jgi:hypothetical protein
METQYEIVNRKFEVIFFPRIRRALNVPVASVRRILLEDGTAAAMNYLNNLAGNPALAAEVRKLYEQVGGRHARMNHSRLMIRKPATESKAFGDNGAWVQFITEYLQRFLLDKITFEVSNTTRDALLRMLTKGVAEGSSVQDMVNDLKDWPYERFQAARIVRTEVNRAANVGAKAQAETSKYEQTKTWVSAHDFRVRGNRRQDHANHVLLDTVKIDMEQQFIDIRSGDALDFPGDPNASAATTCNCRCRIVTQMKRDENGDPIPKKRGVYVQMPGQNRPVRTVTIGSRPSVSVTRPRSTNLPTRTI